jgi:Ca2+-binding RTX toxin-like protein
MGVWTPGPGPTDGDDTFQGDATAEAADGGIGNDTLIGAGGDDTLDGGDGDDILFGFSASPFQSSQSLIESNLLIGGLGHDVLFGAGGTDALRGGDGSDTLVGNGGVDEYDGGAGFDIANIRRIGAISDYVFDFSLIEGAQGLDPDGNMLISIESFAILGGSGSEQIIGGSLGDALNGFGGGDVLFGGGGDDRLSGLDGTDLLHGQAGDDVLVLLGELAEAGDVFDGGEGFDTLEVAGFGGAASGVTLSDLSSVEQIRFVQLSPSGSGLLSLALRFAQASNAFPTNTHVVGSVGTDFLVFASLDPDSASIDLSQWTFEQWTPGQNFFGDPASDQVQIFGGDGAELSVRLGYRRSHRRRPLRVAARR